MAEEMAWNMTDWKWDPFRMVAVPSNLKEAMSSSTTKGPKDLSGTSHGGDNGPVPNPPKKGYPTCQVDGCEADLTALKEYHLRYKICEFHLKVNSIVREGKRQRFCQQCGRFHDMGEFDGEKRSCRARLERHNARRRKKTDQAAVVSAAKKVPQGSSQMLPVQWKAAGSEHMLGPSGVPAPAWLQGGTMMDVGVENALNELLQDANTRIAPGPISMGAIHDSMETAHRPAPFDSSAEQVAAFAREVFGDDPMTEHDKFSSAGPQHFGGFGLPQQQQQQQPPPAQLADFSMRGGLPSGAAYPYAGGSSAPLLSAMQQQQQQQHHLAQQQLQALSGAGAMDLDMGFGGMQGFSVGASSNFNQGQAALFAQQQQQQQQQAGLPLQLDSRLQGNMVATDVNGLSVLDEARSMLSQRHSVYVPEEQFTRVSAKLFNCTPAHLPPDLKQNLVELLRCAGNGLAGTMRPGCVHLTLDSLLGREQANELQKLGVRSAVQVLMQGPCREFWSAEPVLIQLGDEVALVKDGEVLHVLSGRGSQGVFPTIAGVSRLAVAAPAPAAIHVFGNNLTGEDVTLLCRCQGLYVPVQVVGSRTADDMEALEVQLPRSWRCGAVQVEAMRGGFLCPAKPFMVVENDQAVAEIEQLRDPVVANGTNVEAFMLALDRVLEFHNAHLIVRAGSLEPVRDYSPDDVEAVCRLACRLLVFCCDRGWAAVAAMLLPAAALHPAPVGELLAAAGQSCLETGGLSLLHRAVRSGSVELVELLLEWSAEGGYNWSAAEVGPRGITPLHLAALGQDGGAMVEALMDLCEDGQEAWTSAKSEDGCTPADFARLAGNGVEPGAEKKSAAGPLPAAGNKAAATADTGSKTDEEAVAAMPPVKAQAVSSEAQNPVDPLPTNWEVADKDGEREQLESAASGSSSGGEGEAEAASAGVAVAEPLGSTNRHVEEAALFLLGSPAKSPGGLYAEYYMDCQQYGIKVAPTVFSRASALTSAFFVGSVGGLTLFLSH